MPHALGIDVGSVAVKVALIGADGRVRGIWSRLILSHPADPSKVAKTQQEEDRLRSTTGIEKCLATEDAADLLKAVKEVLHVPIPAQGA